MYASSLFGRQTKAPPVRVRLHADDAVEQVFNASFTIGRDESCDVQVPAGRASRRHAEVRLEEGVWWLRDLGSTNGTYLDGARIDEVRLAGSVEVRLGKDGLTLTLTVDGPGDSDDASSNGTAAASGAVETPPPARTRASTTGSSTGDEPVHRTTRKGRSPARVDGADDDAGRFSSTQEYVAHYFDAAGADGGGGEHTRMIRRAYAAVQEEQKRRYGWILGAAGVICVVALAVALWQSWGADPLDDVHYSLRAQEAEMARIRSTLEERYDASLYEQLQEMERQQEAMQERFEGYIEEYGIRRDLTEEERVIFKVARIFNESQTDMPPEFVRAVRDQIRVWQSTGRSTFAGAIRRAEEQNYTGHIVRAMRKYDLPPEFFYLALQESGFRTDAVGPPTRYGHAKGMWQFIPSTGATYGLSLGPRVDDGAYDENDDRHDFEKSTDAAARYLRDIYAYLAQASGLLVIASYNWGEHRVVSKLEELLEGIPDDPKARSYWQFYSVYSDRMPEQTKDYVIKIFSAAVIGENPRLFGFDFDNPLTKHMEKPTAAVQQSGSIR